MNKYIFTTLKKIRNEKSEIWRALKIKNLIDFLLTQFQYGNLSLKKKRKFERIIEGFNINYKLTIDLYSKSEKEKYSHIHNIKW